MYKLLSKIKSFKGTVSSALICIISAILLIHAFRPVEKTERVYAEAIPTQPPATVFYAIEIETPIIQPVPIPVEVPSVVATEDLGEFKITYYDADVKCTGNTRGITKSGAKVTKGVTVAVDPKVIPLGSYLYIEGVGFRVAQDTGSLVKGKVVDIYVPTHKEALENGYSYGKVYIIKEGELIKNGKD